MSQFPPSQPGRPAGDSTMAYNSVAPKTHGMALAAMIMGIVSIPFVCLFGLGVFLGIVALILGIVSLMAINRNPQIYSGKGFAITGIVTGGGGAVLLGTLLAVIMIPSMGR